MREIRYHRLRGGPPGCPGVLAIDDDAGIGVLSFDERSQLKNMARATALLARLTAADLSAEDVEALELARKHLDCSTWMMHQRHDPAVRAHVDECNRALAVLDRLIASKEGK